MLTTVPTYFVATLINDLESDHARKVDGACFRDGSEDEILVDFFRLWGRVVRRSYNRHSTVTTYHYVEGDDLDVFNHYYRAAA